ncbi:isopentenyl-diphosphate delta-isomerase, partial [Candidatus Shapirobacteria bacterium CG_4_9_14_0_2_um_filter_40_11]
MSDQNLILVDEKNNPSGKYAPKRLCHSGKGLTHLAFTLLILNNKNEVLLQDRKHLLW